MNVGGPMTAPLLEVANLSAGYGGQPVLNGVTLGVGEGEALALVGLNGMGKTTTVRAIMGLIPPLAGTVKIAGVDHTGAPAHRIARAGLGLVPEGRQVFPNLSVEENLIATARERDSTRSKQPTTRWNLEAVYRLFPRLKERRAHLGRQLSGGEQQMLAIGRALMTNPRLLILDEATEGLAPLLRAEIWTCLSQLKAGGEAILVIDKSLAELSRLADRMAIIAKGRIVWNGSPAELAADGRVREQFLHL